ncbi:MAG: hypothetical protein GX663_08990 [Clostridiales bacterium]|nr:hypothetical protein [Clostridiales bacterium]
MKVKVMSVEKVTFKDGNTSNRVFAIDEEGRIGNFYTMTEGVKQGSIFELSIGVDNACKFVVRKTFVE